MYVLNTYMYVVLLSMGPGATAVYIPKTTFLSVKLTSTIVKRVKLFHYYFSVTARARDLLLLLLLLASH